MGFTVLAVTGGHRVDLAAFFDMLGHVAAERGWRWAHAVQPGAQAWLDARTPERWSAVLLHDVCGVHLRRGEPPRAVDPDPGVAADLEAMVAAGQGLVVVHHALASWPSWDRWGDALGGRFLYAPGRVRGRAWPSSGTRLAAYDVEVVAPDHPVCDGLTRFRLDDELYLCPVFEDEVVPLLRAGVAPDPTQFTSAYEHVADGPEQAPNCVGHPPGSTLIAWATSAGASPIVVVQPGDNAATFANSSYRRLIANALAWVGSAHAHAWARARACDGSDRTARQEVC